MTSVKVNIIDHGFQILLKELPSHEMLAVSMMAMGKAMPDNITKLDLTKIIAFLFKKLSWVHQEEPLKNEDHQQQCSQHKKSKENVDPVNGKENEDIKTILETWSLHLEQKRKFKETPQKHFDTQPDTSVNNEVVPNLVNSKESKASGEEGVDTQPDASVNNEVFPKLEDSNESKASSEEEDLIDESNPYSFLELNLKKSKRIDDPSLHIPKSERKDTNDMAFTCSVRDKILKIHKGDRPFRCSTCDMKFKKSSHLKRHEQLHTGVKPFSCSHCNKGFLQASN